MNKKLKSIAVAIVGGGLIAALGIVASVDPTDPALSAKALVGSISVAFVTGAARAAQLLVPAAIEAVKSAMAE